LRPVEESPALKLNVKPSELQAKTLSAACGKSGRGRERRAVVVVGVVGGVAPQEMYLVPMTATGTRASTATIDLVTTYTTR